MSQTAPSRSRRRRCCSPWLIPACYSRSNGRAWEVVCGGKGTRKGVSQRRGFYNWLRTEGGHRVGPCLTSQPPAAKPTHASTKRAPAAPGSANNNSSSALRPLRLRLRGAFVFWEVEWIGWAWWSSVGRSVGFAGRGAEGGDRGAAWVGLDLTCCWCHQWWFSRLSKKCGVVLFSFGILTMIACFG